MYMLRLGLVTVHSKCILIIVSSTIVGGRAKLIHIKTSEVSVCMTFSILVSMVFTYLCVYFYILSLFVHNACKNHPESGKMVIGLDFCFMHNLIQLIYMVN